MNQTSAPNEFQGFLIVRGPDEKSAVLGSMGYSRFKFSVIDPNTQVPLIPISSIEALSLKDALRCLGLMIANRNAQGACTLAGRALLLNQKGDALHSFGDGTLFGDKETGKKLTFQDEARLNEIAKWMKGAHSNGDAASFRMREITPNSAFRLNPNGTLRTQLTRDNVGGSVGGSAGSSRSARPEVRDVGQEDVGQEGFSSLFEGQGGSSSGLTEPALTAHNRQQGKGTLGGAMENSSDDTFSISDDTSSFSSDSFVDESDMGSDVSWDVELSDSEAEDSTGNGSSVGSKSLAFTDRGANLPNTRNPPQTTPGRSQLTQKILRNRRNQELLAEKERLRRFQLRLDFVKTQIEKGKKALKNPNLTKNKRRIYELPNLERDETELRRSIERVTAELAALESSDS